MQTGEQLGSGKLTTGVRSGAGHRSLPSSTVTQGRGNRPPQKKLQLSHAEVLEILEKNYQSLVLELNRPFSDFFSGKVVSSLVTFSDSFQKLKKLDWSPLLNEILQTMKKCLVFQYTFKTKLNDELKSDVCPSTRESFHQPSSQSQQSRAIERVVSHAFNILHTILNLLSPKYAFDFFISLMSNTSGNGYVVTSFFKNKNLIHNFRLVPGVNLSNILGLLMAAIRKSKCTLSKGERKVITYNHVPFTSLSTCAVLYLDEFCIFLLNTIDSPISDLSMEEVFSALQNTVAAAPFLSISLDKEVLRRVIALACSSSREETQRSGIPRHLVLSLMSLVLSVEWSIDNVVPKMTHSDFQNYAVTSCIDIVGAFISQVEAKSIKMENILEEIKLADQAICVFVSCVDHHFEQFQPIALHCFRLVSKVLLMELCFEQWFGLSSKHDMAIPAASINERACNTLILGCLLYIKNATKKFGEFLQGINDELDVVDETEQFIEMWFSLLSKSRLFQSTNMEILSALVDCFSAFNETLFESLNDKQRVFCVATTLGYARHGSDMVRAKAARNIALFLEFRCLAEEDIQFLMDCLDVIEFKINAEDHTSSNPRRVNSRLVFSWAVSNLCDALAKYHSQSNHPSLGWKVFNKLYDLNMRFEDDHPKMKYNANRGLGALVQWTPVQFLENPLLEEHIKTIAIVLADQLGSGLDFKARWNASHALGNILRKAEIWTKFQNTLADIVFPAFIRALKAGDNFKERIYCVKSLQSIVTITGYSNYFIEVWMAVMEGFTASYESKVPVPHGIYEIYREEVAQTIMHLAAMTDVPMSTQLETMFIANYETLVEAHAIILNSNKEENARDWIQQGLKNIGDIMNKIQN